MFQAMADELAKIAEEKEVSTQEAKDALRRLRGLERSTPTRGQMLRGGAVGAIVGPAAGAVSDIIMGSQGAGGAKKGLAKALAAGGRKVLARSAVGATYGSVLPYARHRLERAAEMQKLREYVGERKRGLLRSKIRRTTGL